MIGQDVRYALRGLKRSPGFTLAAVFVLALGIGANTAIFTVVHAVLLQPLPYPAPDRLVRLYERNVIGENPYNIVSFVNFLDWQRDAASYLHVAAYGPQTLHLSGSGGAIAEPLAGTLATCDFFDTLGVRPASGRSFVPEDDRPGAHRVVIISNGLWRRRLGGDPSIVGSSIRLDGESFTVIGIMPPGFDFPSSSIQVWTPLRRHFNPAELQSRGSHRWNVLGRLRPGVSVAQAAAELDGIARRIKRQYPEALTGAGASVAPLRERMVFQVRTLLLVLLGAVASVLLIACVNVTNLLLSRAVARRREVAIRIALGAGRTRLVRQFLTESLLLAGLGALLGLLLARWGTALLVRMSANIPRAEAIHVNAWVLLFTGALATLTGVLIGLAPAFFFSGPDLTSAIREGGRTSAGSRKRGLFRDGLVASEVALSLILLIVSGLLAKSFVRLRAVHPGFAPDGVLTMLFALPQSRYGSPPARAVFFESLLAKVKGLPGVAAAGMVTTLPVTGRFVDYTFAIEGRPPLPPGQFLDALLRAADPGYFQVMGIPLKRGRFFLPSERLEQAGKVIISESMARQFFPGEDPLGRRILVGNERSCEIIGVVGDVRSELALEPEPTMYLPLSEGRFRFASLTVRADGSPNFLALPIQKEAGRLDPDLAVVNVRTMQEILSGAAASRRFSLTLLALFAVLALILAAIGLYGVLAYSTAQRTSELGVRMALGATRGDIVRLVLGQALKPAAAGILAGLAAAFALTRVLQSLLFQVGFSDPQVFSLVGIFVAAVALLAGAIPAWRATRIDPAIALRAE